MWLTDPINITKFKESNFYSSAVSISFDFHFEGKWKGFICISSMLKEWHCFKICYSYIDICPSVSDSFLYRIWISVTSLLDNSTLTSASISWEHKSPANYRSRVFIKLFWNMTSTTLQCKIRYSVYIHAAYLAVIGNLECTWHPL
jgi:hypothetical protein